jgi:poly-beta-1,6-N-acetyl-D-glucosamine synthase
VERSGQAVIDHYPRPEEFVRLGTCGELLKKVVFFRCGVETTFFGRCSAEGGRTEDMGMSDWNNSHPRYVVITPVRDEEKHLEKTVRSVVQQTVKPVEWVIVDDGSTDGTADIIERYAKECDWIRGFHRRNRGFRKAGGGVVEAFNDGYKSLRCCDWDFVVKLDGDLSFEPEYFERILDRFSSEPRLGIAGGTLKYVHNGEKNIARNPQFHVRGATKVYRRACWEQIGGLWPGPGWDTVDETKANMLGWKTMSIPNIHAVHHRLTGGADGIWSDSTKHGLICYSVGYHPLFILARCIYRLADRPYAVRSIGIIYGFVRAHLTSAPRVSEAAFIRFVRSEQIKRLMGQESIWR